MEFIFGALWHTYGYHDIWQMKPPEYEAVGFVRGNWFTSLDLEGVGDMIHALRLMERLSWEKRCPNYGILVSPNENPNNKLVAMRGDSYVLVYIPDGKDIVCDLSLFGNGCKLSVRWMSPRTGEYTDAGVCKASNSVGFSVPYDGKEEDWVLLVRK